MADIEFDLDADAASGRGSAPGAQALSKGLSLVGLVADAPVPMRFNDILRATGLTKATLHRLLQALIESRFLRLEPSGAYYLGVRLFEMAHKVWSDFDIRGAAAPELERLRRLSQETARLAVLEGADILIIDQCETAQAMRLSNGVGARLNVRASAMGKAMLAYLPPMQRADLMSHPGFTPPTPRAIADIHGLSRELDLVKARGYAVSEEEQNLGINAVAAPVLNHRGEPIGVVSVCGPSFRLPCDQLHALGTEVIEAARRIAGNYGETFMSISNSVGPELGREPQLECAFASSAFLGESPVWLAEQKSLVWVDILAPSLHMSSLDDGQTKTTPMKELVGVIAPRQGGGFVAATQTGFKDVKLSTGESRLIIAPSDMTGCRFNDGKCDPAGRFWAGTVALDASPDKGALYCLERDRSLRKMADRFHVCNGLGWSPDASVFYFTDSGRRTIYAYDYDLERGELGNRRIFASFSAAEGTPDGLAVDEEGGVWCAMWDGWAVRRYLPDGRLDRTIATPVPRPTSCAFGGEDMQTLFITSARIRLSSAQLAAAPFSGSVFALQTGVRGVPVSKFAG